MLPTGFSYEKEGTVANSARWIQWRWKAVDPPGQAKSDLWIADRLMKAIRKEYQAGGKFTEPIMNMVWNYPDVPGHDEPDITKVAEEMNGVRSGGRHRAGFIRQAERRRLHGLRHMDLYRLLYTDPELKVPACQRRSRNDNGGLSLYPKVVFSPGQPIVALCTTVARLTRPAGHGIPRRSLVSWDGSKWVNNDVPDFGFKDAATGAFIPPENRLLTPLS